MREREKKKVFQSNVKSGKVKPPPPLGVFFFFFNFNVCKLCRHGNKYIAGFEV